MLGLVPHLLSSPSLPSLPVLPFSLSSFSSNVFRVQGLGSDAGPAMYGCVMVCELLNVSQLHLP